MKKQLHLSIGGMTCIQCQNKIEKALRKTRGVQSVTVSYTKGTADLLYEEDLISGEEIAQVIRRLDYEVLSSGKGLSFDLAEAIPILVIIIALFYILQKLGLLNKLVPMGLADSGMGYGTLFVTGLLTSVHCIAMCGGIGLSQSLPGKTVGEKAEGGTGIGLTISKAIVEAHGGTIRCESKIGEGSRFIVTLPVASHSR